MLQHVLQVPKGLLVVREEHGDHPLQQLVLHDPPLFRVGEPSEQGGVLLDDSVKVDLVNQILHGHVELSPSHSEVIKALALDSSERHVVILTVVTDEIILLERLRGQRRLTLACWSILMEMSLMS